MMWLKAAGWFGVMICSLGLVGAPLPAPKLEAAAPPSAYEKRPWPMATRVDAQPLLAQVRRVGQAIKSLGSPLPKGVAANLAKLSPDDEPEKVARTVQKSLDPLCVAAVTVARDGSLRIKPTAGKPELVEQGWRAFLIKVVNPNERTGTLRCESPNARPLPHSTAEEVPGRWLSLSNFASQPLIPELSGLELEYRVISLYSRDRGERSAVLAFRLDSGKGPKKPRNVDIRAWPRATVTFVARPSTALTFRVLEADDQPAMAAFLIRDAQQRVYPAQSKRLAPDLFFQQQVYRQTGEQVRLPPGEYTVKCWRGPESIPETKKIAVGSDPVTLLYQVKRWIDPARDGWYSGDHHIHAAGCAHYERPTEGVRPEDMMRHTQGEDLKVGCCLTWGPCFDFQKRFFTGKPDVVSRHPYLLRYDIEVSGFGSHHSGHLCLLGLKEQMPPGGKSKDHWPTLGLNTLKWAKKQGAVCGPAHSANGLTQTKGKVKGKDGPGGLPNFKIPAFNGIGANEFIVDITHEVPGPDDKPVPAIDFISTMDTDRTAEWNMWYHVLNCGFRIRASGETDFPCIYGERVGIGRVYAKVDSKLSFDRWLKSVADGRSYVSDGTGHLLDFAASAGELKTSMGVDGSEMRLDKSSKVRFTVRAAAWVEGGPMVPVELIVNGYPVAKHDMKADGKMHKLTFDADIEKSSWAAVRIRPRAHTNPIFFLVDGQPVRPSKASAQWCLKGVDQCWSQKKNTYRGKERKEAESAYEHARKVYRRIETEATE
jgi:hypothetical protein